MSNKTLIQKNRRARRIRAKLQGTKERPRLSVFRSNVAFYAQIIDDIKAATLVSATQKEVEKTKGLSKTKAAELVGEQIAKKAKDKKITKVMFDKGPYKYHGRVKAFADAARKGGLQF